MDSKFKPDWKNNCFVINYSIDETTADPFDVPVSQIGCSEILSQQTLNWRSVNPGTTPEPCGMHV